MVFGVFGLVALIQYVFPDITYHEIVGSLLLLFLAGLAVFYDEGTAPIADGSRWAVFVLVGLVVLWATVPFWRKHRERVANKRKMTMAQKFLYFALWIVMVLIVAATAMRGRW